MSGDRDGEWDWLGAASRHGIIFVCCDPGGPSSIHHSYQARYRDVNMNQKRKKPQGLGRRASVTAPSRRQRLALAFPRPSPRMDLKTLEAKLSSLVKTKSKRSSMRFSITSPPTRIPNPFKSNLAFSYPNHEFHHAGATSSTPSSSLWYILIRWVDAFPMPEEGLAWTACRCP